MRDYTQDMCQLKSPVLMFMNMKGGVGKTTLAVEISRTLAHTYDMDVLLIDYDPQANASLAFFEAAEYFQLLDDGISVAHCLMTNTQPDDPFSVVKANASSTVDHQMFSKNVRSWYYPNNPEKKAGRLDLIPGNLDLMRIALNTLTWDTERRLFTRFEGLIASAKSAYDCIVVDCHPAGSFFTKSALLNSNAAIVPVTSDAYAATGLNMMRRHMEMWEASGGAKEFLVVFNDANNAWDVSVETDIRGDKRFADHCLSGRIKYSRLLRNLAKRHRTSAEQKVANRRRVGKIVQSVTAELVDLLKERNIFDSSWG